MPINALSSHWAIFGGAIVSIPRAIAFLPLSCLAWSSAQAGPASDLKMAFDQEKAPYVWSEESRIKGLELDIVSAALSASGHTVTPSILPNRRVAVALSLGEADGVTGMQQGDAGEKAFYSDFYLTYANAAITRTSRNIQLRTLGDILRYHVAAWQKAWQDLGLDRFRPQGPDPTAYTEFTSQYRQTKFFWAGRADIDVVDPNIFIWYSRILSTEMTTSDAVTFHDVVPAVRVRAAFVRASDRDDFDSGMAIIRANGEIGRIYTKYGLVDPEPEARKNP